MYVTTPVRLRGIALRDHVLATALLLFSERGYFNTSIHNIRCAAGIITGAVTSIRRFGSALAKSRGREALLRADLPRVRRCNVGV